MSNPGLRRFGSTSAKANLNNRIRQRQESVASWRNKRNGSSGSERAASSVERVCVVVVSGGERGVAALRRNGWPEMNVVLVRWRSEVTLGAEI